MVPIAIKSHTTFYLTKKTRYNLALLSMVEYISSLGYNWDETASIVQLIPLIFATRMNLMRDVVKTSAS